VKNMYKILKNISGFTLIELLVVIAIIGILAAVGIPWYQGYTIQAKEKQAVNNLQSIKLAQTEYYKDRDNYYPCPVTTTSTTDIDVVFFGGNGELAKGAYNYEITGGCSTYTVQAIPK
jgi:prepilin-type N-terminal cleavage/methylation domain-containing protein